MSDKKNGKKKTDAPEKKGMGILPLLIIAILMASIAAAFLYIYPAMREGGIPSAVALIKNAASSIGGSALTDRNEHRSSDAVTKINNNIAEKFAALEMRETDYTIQYLPSDSLIDIKAIVPRGRPVEWIVKLISDAADGTPYDVYDCACATDAKCEITFKSKTAGHPAVMLRLQQSGRYLSNTARMAILIENFGFEADRMTVEYLSFPEPLTVSLVPSRKLTEWTARIADEYKKEIVISLPMEPLPPQASEYRGAMIMLHYDEQRIRGLIAQAAAAIPNFSGFANFHGARVMEDSRVMEIVLSEASRRKAYFVYSDVSKKSVVPQLVKSMRVQSLPIQGSIDAGMNADQVRERFRRFAMAAEKAERILIRAQPSEAFIEVLREEVPSLKSNGIRLVYVSDLMK